MTALPAWISVALQDRLENVPRAALRERAQTMSNSYRAGGGSDVIRSDLDALAYAVVRMPATFAAARAAIGQGVTIVPAFAPQSALDVGAGPGTASWAAADAWPSLRRTTLVDSNPHLLTLGCQLRGSTAAPDIDVSSAQTSISTSLAEAQAADLVMASYVLGELAAPARNHVIDRLWALTGRLLMIVEPGTPRGFQNILNCRHLLLARGAQLVAPCSHDGLCPLATSERWCHFSARLPRSRDHQITKDAFVPYEDERFSYVIAGKGFAGMTRGRRILATPKATKVSITLSLCAPGTIDEPVIPRRQKDAYRAAKRCAWGDAIDF